MAAGPRKILVAPAWPYAAGHRHLGHVAGFGVPSDVFARYHRLKGNDVLMVSGTDEHGTPVMVAADREGKPYGEVADYYNQSFREDFRRLGLSYDLFSRTTTLNHELVTQDLFRTLFEHGAIVEREMLVSFSPATGHTLPDRYIEGTCPICGYPEARGDQCDNCGNQLDPSELIDPRSRIDGSTPEFRQTKHLFLDLPQFADRLRAWISSHDEWRPERRNFSLALLDEIRPRPITRDLDWGVRIPVPGYSEDEHKRIYVWFDAVIGYLSASIEWAASIGNPDAWRDWWQNPDSEHYYFQGKDNVVFHTVIWPAMLLGYGQGGVYGAGKRGARASGQRRRDRVPDHGGKAVLVEPRLHDLRPRLPRPLRRRRSPLLPRGRGPGDAGHRLHLGRVRPAQQRPAAGQLGQSRQPDPDERPPQLRRRPRARRAHRAGSRAARDDRRRLRRGRRADRAGPLPRRLDEAMRLSSEVNQYVSDQAPWALIKTDRDRAATVLYVALRAVDSLKVIFTPFLPHTSQQLHELLGYDGWLAGPLEFRTVEEEDGRTHEVLTGDYASWIGSWQPSELPPGQTLLEPMPLFRKLDASIVDDELSRA